MKEKNEKRIFKVITYMSFIVITVFTIFMLFPSKELHAQAEFVDDNTFVISNEDFDINEEDVKNLLSFLYHYGHKYNLYEYDLFDGIHEFDVGNNLYDGLSIDYDTLSIDLTYSLKFEYDNHGLLYFYMIDYENNFIIDVYWDKLNNEVIITDIATNPFTVVITLPKPPIALYNSLHGVINFFVQPFLDLITDIGVGDNIISIGFGSIEWFNFTLLQLANLILSFLVIWIFLKLIFKLLKLVVRIITGGAINV